MFSLIRIGSGSEKNRTVDFTFCDTPVNADDWIKVIQVLNKPPPVKINTSVQEHTYIHFRVTNGRFEKSEVGGPDDQKNWFQIKLPKDAYALVSEYNDDGPIDDFDIKTGEVKVMAVWTRDDFNGSSGPFIHFKSFDYGESWFPDTTEVQSEAFDTDNYSD